MLQQDDPYARLDNLIALILDAKGCKARLDELRKAEDKLAETTKRNEKLEADTAKNKAAAERILAEANEKTNAANVATAGFDRRAAQLADLASALQAREKEVNQKEAQAKHVMLDAGRKENDVEAREKALAVKVAAHQKAVDEFAAKVKAFNERKAKLLELGA